MILATIGAAAEVVADVAKGIWKLLPPKVWLYLALAAAAWWAVVHYGNGRHDAGVAEERGRWETAQREADARAARDKAARDASTAKIDQSHQAHGAKVETETRKTTDAAVERADHAMHTAPPTPAGCPSGLPDSVRDEGRAAVDRANRAGDPLRAR